MSEFRQMRRKRQQLTQEESIAILQKATAGTLAPIGENSSNFAMETRSLTYPFRKERESRMTQK